MNARSQKNHESAEAGKEKKTGNLRGTGSGESCRCKDTSQMKPVQLLKLMLNDLAFWKKAGK